jgi:photoactive yellow protein
MSDESMSLHDEPSFDAPDISRLLEALPDESLHALPYGVIRLDAEGRITFFSDTERRLSGYTGAGPIGLHLFTEVAPCMNTPYFRGRVDEALKRGDVDLEMGHTGDFADRTRFMRARVVSASDGGRWQLHLRD